MGGAHNVVLNQIKNGSYQPKAAAPKVNVPTQASMGGAHNSALNAIAMQSNAKKNAKVTTPTVASALSNRKPLSQEEFNKNLKVVGAFVGLIGTVGACIYFFVSLKVYHGSLEKLDALNNLLANPNARVATADQGKQIMR
jgi:preprotein translocase subunit Sss1